MLRSISGLNTIAAAAIALSAWATAAQAADATKVALVPGGPHPYFAAWERAGQDAMKEFNLGAADYRVPQKWELSVQNSLLESLLSQGYNAFLVFPGDPVGSNSTVQELTENGAPVIATAGCLKEPTTASFCFGTDTGNSAYLGTKELIKAMGGKGAIVVDIDANKREAAEKAGALATVDGNAVDALEQLTKKAGEPIRAVIDLVGNAKTTQLGFDCLTKGGKLVIVGLFGGGAPWALPLIPIKAITIQGSYVGNLRETEELLDLVRAKKIAPIPVTPMPLAKANDALASLKEGRQIGRAILTP